MTLLVSLPLPGADETDIAVWSWAISEDGCTVSAQGEATLETLPMSSGTMWAVVTAAALSWHRVVLPTRARNSRPSVLRALLEAALEEHLLVDPAGVHMALPPNDVSHAGDAAPVWIACCGKDWLAQRLRQLAQHGLECRRILPAAWPRDTELDADLSAAECDVEAPAHGEDWLLAFELQSIWLQVSGIDGVWRAPLCTAASLQQAIGTMSAGFAPAQAWSSALERMHVHPQADSVVREWIGRELPQRQPAQDWLAAAGAGWNLAQGEFSQQIAQRLRRETVQHLRHFAQAPEWRLARVAIWLLALGQLAGLNALAWQQRHEVFAKREEIRSLLLSQFPSLPLVLDAPRQMAGQVEGLRRAAGELADTDMESLLQALAASVPSGRSIGTMDYRSGELRIGGLKLDTAELESAQRHLAGSHLRLNTSPEPGQFVMVRQASSDTFREAPR